MEKAYERIWNFETKPFSLEARKDFKCLFCGGEMVVSHGQIFTFRLGLHKDAQKQSHAIDTWLNCWDCGWTPVCGVAVPKEKYEAFTNMIYKAPRVDKQGKEVEKVKGKMEIPEGMSATIFPHDKRKRQRRLPLKMWQETNDIKGLKPLFPMTCKFCGYKEPMFLRHSRMHLVKRNKLLKSIKIPSFIPLLGNIEIKVTSPLTTKAYTTSAFRQSYKCPVCDWLATFVRPVRRSYFEYILALRDGQPLYYPPLKEWEAEAARLEDEREQSLIQEKLESLGYV